MDIRNGQLSSFTEANATGHTNTPSHRHNTTLSLAPHTLGDLTPKDAFQRGEKSVVISTPEAARLLGGTLTTALTLKPRGHHLTATPALPTSVRSTA